MARYLLRVTDSDAARLESWLGGAIRLVPSGPDDILADLRTADGYVPDYRRAEADRRLAAREPVVVAGLDAITEAEYEAAIAPRLRSSGPLYHAGGAGLMVGWNAGESMPLRRELDLYDVSFLMSSFGGSLDLFAALARVGLSFLSYQRWIADPARYLPPDPVTSWEENMRWDFRLVDTCQVSA